MWYICCGGFNKAVVHTDYYKKILQEKPTDQLADEIERVKISFHLIFFD
jgi:hypothetical protein